MTALTISDVEGVWRLRIIDVDGDVLEELVDVVAGLTRSLAFVELALRDLSHPQPEQPQLRLVPLEQHQVLRPATHAQPLE